MLTLAICYSVKEIEALCVLLHFSYTPSALYEQSSSLSDIMILIDEFNYDAIILLLCHFLIILCSCVHCAVFLCYHFLFLDFSVLFLK